MRTESGLAIADRILIKSFENMVARDGVEPPTPAFSGLYSAIHKRLKILNLPPEITVFRG